LVIVRTCVSAVRSTACCLEALARAENKKGALNTSNTGTERREQTPRACCKDVRITTYLTAKAPLTDPASFMSHGSEHADVGDVVDNAMVGNPVGARVVGAAVGLMVGTADGGCVDGAFVGDVGFVPVGARVDGAAVGRAVGGKDGCAVVGAFVGAAEVGCRVLGAAVGLTDVACVGGPVMVTAST
jgi:hypothetical protein